jgi:hypothetical protein
MILLQSVVEYFRNETVALESVLNAELEQYNRIKVCLCLRLM